MTRLRNESDYEFEEIASEKYREYDFGDGNVVRIEDPLWLAESSDGHRIHDGEEVSHYIPYGWKEVRWEVSGEEPHFVE